MSKLLSIGVWLNLAMLIGGIVVVYIASVSAENKTLFVIGGGFLIIGFLGFTLGLGWWVLAKASEFIVSKVPSNNQALKTALYLVGVPVLMSILCVVVASTFFYIRAAISIQKYGANFETMNDDQVYPGHWVISPSGLFTAEVKVPEDNRFIVGINAIDIGESYQDNKIFTAAWMASGDISWASGMDILLVDAQEGQFLYYLNKNGWVKVNRQTETMQECQDLKAILGEYKNEIFTGAMLVQCPEQ